MFHLHPKWVAWRTRKSYGIYQGSKNEKSLSGFQKSKPFFWTSNYKWMNKWMNEWMKEWMNEGMNEGISENERGYRNGDRCWNRLFEQLRHLRDQPTNRHKDMITDKLCNDINKKFKNTKSEQNQRPQARYYCSLSSHVRKFLRKKNSCPKAIYGQRYLLHFSVYCDGKWEEAVPKVLYKQGAL